MNDDISNNKNISKISKRKEKAKNKRIIKNNILGFKCIIDNVKKDSKYMWKAKIIFNDQLIHLGLFETSEEAIAAYDSKEKELLGKSYGKIGYEQNS